PGGRAESDDRSALEVAQRETFEEVGLKLETYQRIGDLSEMPISYRGTDTGSVLSPFVFYAGSRLPALTPNEEAAAAYWIPLVHLWSGENCDTVTWMHEGRERLFAGIRYDGQVIWGLTYRVLEMFAALLDKPLPCGSALT
ncbi:MAG: CoA pyrophosphatase, partial [bacterium]|nr:CoA pyrophosphatase [bacterium]